MAFSLLKAICLLSQETTKPLFSKKEKIDHFVATYANQALATDLIFKTLGRNISCLPLYWTKKQDKDDRRSADMICRIN